MTTDELRAKFEAWMASREGFPFAHQYANLMWATWQAAHTSRDAEVEALRYGLSEAREGWHQANGVADLAIQHRDAAEAEVDALRKDAERWHAVRSCAGNVGVYEGTPTYDPGVELLLDEEADQAIDAAMREGEW